MSRSKKTNRTKYSHARDPEGYIILHFPRPTPDFIECIGRGYFSIRKIFGVECETHPEFYARVSKIRGRKLYLSDDEGRCMTAHLASQAVDAIQTNGITKTDLVLVRNYAVTNIKKKKTVIICELVKA